MIPYGRHWIDEDDIRAVVEVLKSDWLTQGPKIDEFEKALAEYCGAKYAVAISNGTAALHLACLAAGIKEEDEVITTPITFIASANCAVYCGANPVFADIGKDTYNIDPAEIEDKTTSKTKAIIPVHFAGLPCDMEEISEIAKKHGLIIIEDACHALGAEYQANGEWVKIGSCRHSDMAVFSFHPVKHITTGEGGVILTNNQQLYEKLLLLRTHGITKNAQKFVNKNMAFSNDSEPLRANPWYYEMHALGFNYRLTDIQCALGLSQLNKLDKFVARRRTIASMYSEAFKKIEYVKTPIEPETKKSAYHLYVLQIDFEKIGKSRARVMTELMEVGIGTQVHYIPVYMQPYYGNERNYKKQRCAVVEQYYGKTLSIPLYPKMTDAEVTKVINSMKGCLDVG